MKKEINQKSRIRGLIICVILTSTLFSQSEFCAFKSAATSTHPSQAYQPTSCARLLEDLVPTSNDAVINVNVKFWIFAPTTNSASGAWTYSLAPTTSVTLQDLLDGANTTYSSIPAIPNLPVAGTSTTFTNVKIKLVLKGYEFINDDFAYENIEYYSCVATQYDPNAINVYVGTWTAVATGTISGTQTTYTYVGQNERMATCNDNDGLGINRIYLTPSWYKVSTPVLHDDLSLYGGTFAHEAGHVFGLDHTTSVVTTAAGVDTSFTYVKSPLSGCCLYTHVMDTYFENYPPTPPQCTSDNLMSQDAGCNRYLSPQQAGVMHYTLRSRMSNLITTSSYSDAMDRNPAFDYSVTANETIENTNRYFKGNITVKANKTLIIKCGVFMPRYSKIIVEKGAQLVIDGGFITNIGGRLWDGIYLTGDPAASQQQTNPSNSGALLNQALLRIKNGGTISQAAVGVRNYYTNYGDAGGVIFASNANFLNNITDVEMLHPITGGSIPVPSSSWFYYCNFKTTAPIANNLQPNQHVFLLNVSGVKFRACTFKCEYTPLNSIRNGIKSVDAVYTVDKDATTPCVFENLNRGLFVNNANPLKTPAIANSSFVDNFYGGYFLNAYNLSILSNTFSGVSNYGISDVYLNNCKYYKVKNNQFQYTTNYSPSGVGIEVYKSKTGAHEIYRNSFANLYKSINCMDDNGNPNNPSDGLKINCNKFTGTSQYAAAPNSYDVVLSHTAGLGLPRVNKTQGEISSSATQFNLVRNIYAANCGNENKWQIYSGSTVTIDHGSNSNTVTAVTQPTATGCKSSYLNVVNKSIVLDYPNDCSLTPPSSGGTSSLSSNRIGTMNDYITGLKDDESTYGVSHHFEIQSTVASKLSLFTTDSVNHNFDSIVDILENNQGYMEDADILTVFAYMQKGDYDAATDKISALGSERSDWASLLTKLIAIETNLDDVVNIIDVNNTFFTDIAGDSDADGHAATQALLEAFYNTSYTEPHAEPEGVSSSRLMNTTSIKNKEEAAISNSNVHVYPNPTQNGINIDYNIDEIATVKIEVKDLLGRIIYANFISGTFIKHYVPLNDFKSGMYLLSLKKDNNLIYTTKIIKED